MSADRLLVELALSGRLSQDDLYRWLTPLGVGEQVAVLVFAAHDVEQALPLLEQSLRREGVLALTATCDGLLCAIVDCGTQGGAVGESGGSSPLTIAARCRAELCEHLGKVRAAVSRPAPASAVALGYREARSALDAASAADAGAPEVASYEDLGALKLLLALQTRQALETFCHTVLGPIEGQGRDYGEELLRSADSFIEHNGHWEHAARSLYCHRHTLRYRIRRVEQLTKRDLSRARDRIELWLALRGRELVR
ncbi:MAG: PucR family transcriptional regulator [Solirubrobacteraceae bacterium]